MIFNELYCLIFLMFDTFYKFSLLMFEHVFSVIRIFQDQKSILFDTENLAFMFFVDFEKFGFFDFCHFSSFFGSESRAVWIFRFF